VDTTGADEPMLFKPILVFKLGAAIEEDTKRLGDLN
jgi:hypothetical protein